VKSVKKTSGGKGELRYNVVYPKSRKDWIAKPIFENMSYEHVYDMIQNVLYLQTGLVTSEWESKQKDKPSNIARVPKPIKEEVVLKHVSRFGKMSSQ
jgi:hypothetical protein